jgi:hypothetical protein
MQLLHACADCRHADFKDDDGQAYDEDLDIGEALEGFALYAKHIEESKAAAPKQRSSVKAKTSTAAAAAATADADSDADAAKDAKDMFESDEDSAVAAGLPPRKGKLSVTQYTLRCDNLPHKCLYTSRYMV